MNKYIQVGTLIAVSVLTGCATQSSKEFRPFQPSSLNELVESGRLVQKTNSFFVLNDSSSSMSSDYLGTDNLGKTKLDVEKNLLNRFNQTIPSIKLSSGLRSFGFGPCLGWADTLLVQPMQSYSANSFASAIAALECSSGGTPLAEGIAASQQDLASAPGNIALIVFSDGMDSASPIPATEELKSQFGDRLCVHTVWVGNEADEPGRNELINIANTTGCGSSTSADAIASPQGMANFVRTVFFKEGTPVVDNDEDKDGVVDSKDKCPGTPRGAIVDKDGCWAFHGLLFDFDSDKVKSQYGPLIQNAVDVMKLNPELSVEIQGHTDSIGSDAYNQKLSERRANSVKNQIVKHGIDGSRLTTVGKGESDPVDTNETEEGRAYNRRVTYSRTDK
ncbi:MAG: OmpA family protein [Gammaproteobacteria bacterium]